MPLSHRQLVQKFCSSRRSHETPSPRNSYLPEPYEEQVKIHQYHWIIGTGSRSVNGWHLHCFYSEDKLPQVLFTLGLSFYHWHSQKRYNSAETMLMGSHLMINSYECKNVLVYHDNRRKVLHLPHSRSDDRPDRKLYRKTMPSHEASIPWTE